MGNRVFLMWSDLILSLIFFFQSGNHLKQQGFHFLISFWKMRESKREQRAKMFWITPLSRQTFLAFCDWHILRAYQLGVPKIPSMQCRICFPITNIFPHPPTPDGEKFQKVEDKFIFPAKSINDYKMNQPLEEKASRWNFSLWGWGRERRREKKQKKREMTLCE